MNIILASIFFLISIVFVIISVVVWKFEKFNIINIYNSDMVKDKKGYAKFMGITYIIVAILELITSIIVLFDYFVAMFIPQIQILLTLGFKYLRVLVNLFNIINLLSILLQLNISC